MPTGSRSRRSSGQVQHSHSTRGRFQNPHTSSSSSSAFASSTSSSFCSPPTAFFHDTHHRSSSPTRVNLYTTSYSNSNSNSFRFSIGRSSSPSRSIPKQNHPISLPKKTCMCSPTTHPGSFRCSLHKNTRTRNHGSGSAPYTPNRLNMMRSAMKNSLVRIGGVEGEWVKRALTALIRPSSHQQRRRADFKPKPSRLSVMSKAESL
ncbi:putative protein TPRXL [Manihot esculenta]|uniref:Serine-rich protein-like protein n=3 Tax=Manihot esculenta TaxID=3983 RepID=A0A2C9W516_MANES|nr:putative protein TPRXL [Manihot esculenta]KAG8656835.1 hypothetical protein MANES_03G012500v8 [Manihot esculenta]KAG8656836.1 hypothetical protein MANES_03G012500v8 [Manihot esculenta]OAY53642.1 hypothetical protein MANES_03G012500v8 [Manihot esculenta]